MSTLVRLDRLDKDSITDIVLSGSVAYDIDDYNLFSVNINDVNAKNVLINIPSKPLVFDSNKIQQLFNTEFEEFID